jgi:hypothetical protein
MLPVHNRDSSFSSKPDARAAKSPGPRQNPCCTPPLFAHFSLFHPPTKINLFHYINRPQFTSCQVRQYLCVCDTLIALHNR